MIRRIWVLSVLWAGLSGCDEYERFRQKLDMYNNEEQGFTPVPGTPVSLWLEPVSSAASTDVNGVLEAMDVAVAEKGSANLRALGLLTEEAGKPATVSPAAAAVLTENQKSKENFASSTFARDSGSFYSRKAPGQGLFLNHHAVMLADTVTWTATADRFTVSVLDKMPVRQQGQRGTCAAHAGIGQIEAMILKKYPTITSIDLSEQRFYYMSKPEHWETGGDVASSGSEPGSGMATSSGYDWASYDASWKYPADWPDGLNIPLESDCPYNPALGANDLQTPHVAGCNNGVVKITNYVAWIHNAENDLTTPQQIYDFLIEKDYPVVTATKLSANWEDNDGIITLADAGNPGDSSHASGHAYLIVGARKLDEAQFPGEGGMCFVIRNSWGSGWGVNGTSCMTLAWFNAWRFTGSSFGLALGIEMDETKVEEAKATESDVPGTIAEPDPGTKQSDKEVPFGGLSKKRGTARVDNLVSREAPPGLSQHISSAGISLTAGDMTVGRLYAADGQTYKVLYRADGGNLILRGVLKGQAKQTHDLTFALRDNRYLMFTPPGRAALTFGEVDSATHVITLCSKAYAGVCDLNYIPEWNELVTGLTEGEARREDPAEPFAWNGLDFAGYGVEVSVPEDSFGRVDLRFKLDGAYTNPQRFAVDLVGGAIRWHGREIGNYQKFSVCSGDYAALCRIVVSGADFHVLFKAQKK